MSKDEIIDILDLMVQSIHLVQARFSKIETADDFILSPEGVTLLDAISMRLQVVGESVKQIQNTDPSILEHHKGIEWDKISKFRDLVSHHYEHVDHEIIYDICNVHIPKLKDAVWVLCNGISNSGKA
jgi:uncharacterized protein with HEPN domain